MFCFENESNINLFQLPWDCVRGLERCKGGDVVCSFWLSPLAVYCDNGDGDDNVWCCDVLLPPDTIVDKFGCDPTTLSKCVFRTGLCLGDDLQIN